MKRCPTCERPAPDDLTFCVDDGAALAPTAVTTFADLAGRVTIDRALRLARRLCAAWSPARTGGRAPPPVLPLEVEVGDDDRVALTFGHEASAAVEGELDATAPFAAPESFTAGAARTEAASVYHVGALVHHLLTGSPPFEGATTAAIAVRKLLESPPSARSIRPDVPTALCEVLERALEREASRRYATLAALDAALDAVAPDPAVEPPAIASFAPPPAALAGAPSPAAPPPLAAAPPARASKRARGMALAVSALLLVAAAGALTLSSTGRSRDAASAPSSPAAEAPQAPEGQPTPNTVAAPPVASVAPVAPVVPVAPLLNPMMSPGGAGAPVTVSVRRSRRPRRRAEDEDLPRRRSGDLANVEPPASEIDSPIALPRQQPGADAERRGSSGVDGAAAPDAAVAGGAPAAQVAEGERLPNPPSAPGDAEASTTTAAASTGTAPAPVPSPTVTEGPSDGQPLGLLFVAGAAGLLLLSAGLIARRRAQRVALLERAPTVPPPAPPAPPMVSSSPRPAVIAPTAVVTPDGAATVPDAPVWTGTAPEALARTVALSGIWCVRCGTPSPADARFCPTDGADLRTHGTTIDPHAAPPAANTQPEMKPFAVGRYRCESRLGEGGMGVVYRASELTTGAPCAVKVLLVRGSTESTLAERFRREAQLAAAVRHPNCVAIYDYGEVAGQLFYLAMELVEGRSLDAALNGRAMPLPRVAAIVGQVCAAVHAAHAAGIIHRDLKPQNVMVREGDVVKLVDFGIARDLNAAKTTLAGVVVGTPAYMAPEQARAEPDVDGRADVFSIGVMTWELLTGRLPFEPAGTLIQQVVARATLRTGVPPTGLSRAVDTALACATDPDTTRRTSDLRQFARELDAALTAAA